MAKFVPTSGGSAGGPSPFFKFLNQYEFRESGSAITLRDLSGGGAAQSTLIFDSDDGNWEAGLIVDGRSTDVQGSKYLGFSAHGGAALGNAPYIDFYMTKDGTEQHLELRSPNGTVSLRNDNDGQTMVFLLSPGDYNNRFELWHTVGAGWTIDCPDLSFGSAPKAVGYEFIGQNSYLQYNNIYFEEGAKWLDLAADYIRMAFDGSNNTSIYSYNGRGQIEVQGGYLLFRSSAADGPTTVGFSFNTDALANATAKLANWTNNEVEQAFLGADGVFGAKGLSITQDQGLLRLNGLVNGRSVFLWAYQQDQIAHIGSVGSSQYTTLLIAEPGALNEQGLSIDVSEADIRMMWGGKLSLITAAEGATSPLFLSNVADGAGNVGFTFNASSLTDPGSKLVAFQRGGTDVAFIGVDGSYNFSANSYLSNKELRLRGPNDAVGAFGVVLESYNTYSRVQLSGGDASDPYVQAYTYVGGITRSISISAHSGGGELKTQIINLKLITGASGAGVNGFVFDSTDALSGNSKLISIQNDSVEYAYIGLAGQYNIPSQGGTGSAYVGPGTVSAGYGGANGASPYLQADATSATVGAGIANYNGPTFILRATAASAMGTEFVISVPNEDAARYGLAIDIYNAQNGTPTALASQYSRLVHFKSAGVIKSNIGLDGSYHIGGLTDYLKISAAADAGAVYLSDPLDDNAAIAHKFDSERILGDLFPLAKLISFQNHHVEKSYLDKDGHHIDNVLLWDDVQGPANQGIGASALTAEAYRDTPAVLLFMRHNEDDSLTFALQMPHSWKRNTEVRFHAHLIPMVSPVAPGGEVVHFAYSYAWSKPGVELPANASWTSGTYNFTVAGDGSMTFKEQVVSLFNTTPTGAKESAILVVNLKRLGTSPNDTYDTNKVGGTGAANLCVLSVDAHFQKEKHGTTTEIPA